MKSARLSSHIISDNNLLVIRVLRSILEDLQAWIEKGHWESVCTFLPSACDDETDQPSAICLSSG